MKALVCAGLGALFTGLSIPPHAAALDGVRALHRHADPAVHQVVDKRCTSRQGGRHCRNALPRRTAEAKQRGYGYAYGAPKAEFYPMGSAEWWQAMEREGRTGNTRD
jgi:hypothetical protein